MLSVSPTQGTLQMWFIIIIIAAVMDICALLTHVLQLSRWSGGETLVPVTLPRTPGPPAHRVVSVGQLEWTGLRASGGLRGLTCTCPTQLPGVPFPIRVSKYASVLFYSF